MAIGWICLVALITFTPAAPSRAWVEGGYRTCIICGERGTGDAILNVVLFVPLGLLLGRMWSPGKVALVGLLVSGVVEGVQASVPGRFSGVADLVWNTTGAGLGAWMAAYLAHVLRIPRPWSLSPRRPAALLASSLPLAYLTSFGVLLHPVGTEEPYVGMVNPRLEQFARYPGEIHHVELSGEPLSSVPWIPKFDPRFAPDEEWVLRLAVTKAPPPDGIAALATIYDMEQNEILLLGVLGEDLVWRERRWADVARMDRPLMRWRGALRELLSGDTAVIEVRGTGTARCLAVDAATRCDLGVTPGDTWSFLLSLDGASASLQAVLGTGWMAVLLFPLGLLGGPLTRTVALGGLTAIGVLLIAVLTPFSPPPWWEWSGFVLGVVVGIGSRAPTTAFLSGGPRFMSAP